MQVVCATCQLSFDAPEGATGLVCPICRGPLRPQSAEGSAAAPGRTAQDWSGGDLDDLIAILSGPAVSARVEVLAPKGDEVLGEIHLLAGGVSDSLFNGKSTDDALDRLRALNPTRFRVDQRLPNPQDGSLANPGPETGTLDGRALAHLMRYCEDYVISCSIEVWRGNETARVEYKRGEISGVTVGGIDAPERLAEVMQWSSGNYRLIVPPFQLPATAPKRVKPDKAAMTPVPVPAASAQAARASSTKTIFGMPVAELAKTRVGADAVKPSPAAAPVAQPPVTAAASSQPAAVPVTAPAPTPAPAPAVQPAASRPATAPSPAPGTPATRTIFGVPAAQVPEEFVSGQIAAAAEESETARTEQARAEQRKTGARKTGVPAPAMAPPATAPAPAPAAPAPAPVAAAPVAATTESTEPTTRPGYEPRVEPRKKPEPAAAAKPEPKPEPKTEPTTAPAKPQTSVAAYVGVGFAFGLALLGVYELYALLAH